jgi:hypothetical protein
VSDAALVLDFAVRGRSGQATVTVASNAEPESIGCAPAAFGFPVCEAIVDSDLRGYHSLLGWLQVVGTRSSPDTERRFEIDPLRIFQDLDLPFSFYGINPTLFDAPWRTHRDQYLDWLAHSFLCASPGDPMDRDVRPVAAFQWGFVLDHGAIEIVNPSPLTMTEWTTHRSQLMTAYPSWAF